MCVCYGGTIQGSLGNILPYIMVTYFGGLVIGLLMFVAAGHLSFQPNDVATAALVVYFACVVPRTIPGANDFVLQSLCERKVLGSPCDSCVRH